MPLERALGMLTEVTQSDPEQQHDGRDGKVDVHGSSVQVPSNVITDNEKYQLHEVARQSENDRIERMLRNHRGRLTRELNELASPLTSLQMAGSKTSELMAAEVVLLITSLLLRHCQQNCFCLDELVLWEHLHSKHKRIDPKHSTLCLNAQLEARAWLKRHTLVVVPLPRLAGSTNVVAFAHETGLGINLAKTLLTTDRQASRQIAHLINAARRSWTDIVESFTSTER